MTHFPFARQSADSFDDREFSGERLLNYYPRVFPDQGVSPLILKQRQGLKTFADLGTSFPVQALHLFNDKMYAASGGKLYDVDAGGTVTEIGNVSEGQTRIDNNGTEVAVSANGNYYVWDGITLSTPSTGNLTYVQDIAFLDGYIILVGTGSGRPDRITVTSLLDATTIDGADVATAESRPDALQAIIVDHSEIWLFGETSIEVWYNVGGVDFPFLRAENGVIERGCRDGRTAAKEDNTIFWLGDDGVVYRAQGYNPQRISTHAVEYAVSRATDFRAMTYTIDGHKFYTLWMNGRPAWSYDIASNAWHEVNTGAGEGQWVGVTAEAAWGKELVGGYDGVIYEFDADTFADGSSVMRRHAVSMPFVRKGERFTVGKVRLHFKTGGEDIGRTPKVMFQTTKDGREWSLEKWRDLGDLGDYDRIVSWNGLGVFRRLQGRFTITDPVLADMYGADLWLR